MFEFLLNMVKLQKADAAYIEKMYEKGRITQEEKELLLSMLEG